MNLQNDDNLDNPAWHSLNETHERFALSYDNLKCYHPDYCPFGGYENDNRIVEGIEEYAKVIDNFYIIGTKHEFPERLTLKNELVCLQMVLHYKTDIKIQEEIIRLNDTYNRNLVELVNLVQPGYFKSKTMLLGDYYGIFKNGILVAVTGERMKMNQFTELSAIVTHPDHTGKGYAKQLIAHTVSKIIDENKVPYLHVAETNVGAIRLYAKLGFRIRRKMSFWNFAS